MSDAISRRWIAYEKNAAVALGQVRSETAKNICLDGGGKVPRRRIWVDDIPPPDCALQQKITAIAETISATKLWRSAGGQTLPLAELTAALRAALDVHDDDHTAWQLAVLQTVLKNPIYFYRRDNRIQAVSDAIVQQALRSSNDREREKQQEEALLLLLQRGEVPAAIANEMTMLLYQPQKNTICYRALKKYLNGDGDKFARFFINSGLLTNELDYLRQTFEQQWPAAAAAEADTAAVELPPLPRAPAPAFSIDDEGTIEIDDAFSLRAVGDGVWRIGVHIAAPALMLSQASDDAARARQVSVYFPDAKYCMLPASAIAACSLAVGEYRPAISLYLDVNEKDNSWRAAATTVEMLCLTGAITPLQADAGEAPADINNTYQTLSALAALLPAPETTVKHGGDYKIDARRHKIIYRPRQGAVRLVEILMRTTNSIWAQQIAAAGIGGLFRSDSALKLTPPRAAPYMWLTSPLRRYVDLANQRQLLALINQTAPAAENWRALRRLFEHKYSLARRYQRTMEQCWMLRIVQQTHAADTLGGDYLGDNKVRLRDYPLNGFLTKDSKRPQMPGAVSVRIETVDLLKQQLTLTLADSPRG